MALNFALKKTGAWTAILVVGGSILVFILFLLWRMFWVTNVENYEYAFSFDRWSGKIERIERAGWISRTPILVSVHTIDLRPYQISIVANIQKNASGGSTQGGDSNNAIGARVLNAKLVRFNPNGLDTFIQWHGRNAADSLPQMLEILKAYAFDKDEGRDCPFLTVVSEIAPKQGSQTAAVEQKAKP